MVTLALGTTAPVGSKTVPLMPPRLVCAIAHTSHNVDTARIRLPCIATPLQLSFRITAPDSIPFHAPLAAWRHEGVEPASAPPLGRGEFRSEEHTSELQSRQYLI